MTPLKGLSKLAATFAATYTKPNPKPLGVINAKGIAATAAKVFQHLSSNSAAQTRIAKNSKVTDWASISKPFPSTTPDRNYTVVSIATNQQPTFLKPTPVAATMSDQDSMDLDATFIAGDKRKAEESTGPSAKKTTTMQAMANVYKARVDETKNKLVMKKGL